MTGVQTCALPIYLWWHGPRWLASPELWPADALNEPSEESQIEAKLVQKVLGVAVDEKNEVEEVLHKFQLQKAVHNCAWIWRFLHTTLSEAEEHHTSWDH